MWVAHINVHILTLNVYITHINVHINVSISHYVLNVHINV